MNLESSSPTLSDLHSHGFELITSSNFNKAIDHFTHLVNNNSDDYLAYQGLSIALEKRGNVDEAIINITKAIEINPSFSTLYVFKAFFLLKANQDSDALINITHCLKLDPNNEIAHNIFQTIQNRNQVNRRSVVEVPLNWGGNKKNGLNIERFLFSHPFVYWSQGKPDCFEPSCIDVTQPVGSPFSITKKLPSFPNYSDMDPDQRLQYLSWLHEGREKNLDDDGYLFLYFFGLERRVLLDKEDEEKILQECLNLKKKVPSPSSNFSFISSFIAYLVGKRVTTLSKKELTDYFPQTDEIGPFELRVILSWYCENKKPINGLLSYLTLYYFLNVPKKFDKKTIREKKDLFLKLFKHHYPSGFPIQASRFPYKFQYHPANPIIRSFFQENEPIEEVIVQNPIGKKTQFNRLRELWTQSLNFNSLDELNNELKNHDYEVITKTDSTVCKASRVIEAWESIISSVYNNGNKDLIIPVRELDIIKRIIGTRNTDGNDLYNIIAFINSQGYEIVPDNYDTLVSSEYIGLILRPPNAESHSIQYETALFFIELGMHVAHADKKVTLEELNYLSNYVTRQFSLNTHDLECFKLYQKILISYPPNVEILIKQINSQVPVSKREILASYIVDVIIADKIIHDLEIASLIQVLSWMGIPSSEANILIQKRLIELNIQDEVYSLVSIKSSIVLDPGEPIQQQVCSISPIIGNKNHVIDDDDQIVIILDSALNGNHEEERNERKSNFPNKSCLLQYDQIQQYIDYSIICSLEKQYYPVLEAALKNSKWTVKEFTSFVKKNEIFGLNRTIEALNLWSLIHYDDHIIIENGDEIVVNQEILSLIKQKM